MTSVFFKKDRLAVLLDSVPACVTYIDKDLRYRYLNKAAEKLLKKTGEQVEGKHMAEVLGERAFNERKKEVAKVLAGETIHFERHSDISEGKAFDITYSPDFDADGNVIGFTILANDITARVQAEQQLAAKSRELQDYIENANIALHWVNAEGIIVWANKAELDMLGYTAEEYIGRHISEFHADKKKIEDILSRLSGNETLDQLEAQLKHKDGSLRTVLISSNVLWENGRFIHTRCFTLDITEKRKAEKLVFDVNLNLERLVQERTEELRLSEERHHRMIAEVQDYAILLMDKDGNILNWNKGAEKIKGYKPEEIVGQNFRIFYMPADRESRLPEQLIHEAASKGRATHEGWRLRKDGTRFWGSIVITALHNNSGEVIGFSKVTRDLTERKMGEEDLKRRTEELEILNQELRLSEQRYQRMINEVRDYAILLLDKEGHILNWNKGAEAIKGYKAEEIIGRHIREFYTKEDQARRLPERLIEEATREGRAALEGWRLRKDGTSFWGSVVLTALHNETGELVGFSKVTRDLTERKRAEIKMQQYTTQLEQKNRELEQFAYVASHDLQEPLRKIRTFNEMILKADADKLSERGKDYFSRSVQAADRMSKLIDDLLLYSRTSTEPRNFEEVNLNKLIDDILVSLRETIEERHAKIEVGKLPALRVVPVQFQQLFENLIGNALKYRHPERLPLISIRAESIAASDIKEKEAEPGRTYCRISISDNGIGFDQQYAAKIFELFQRLHGRSEYTGSGVGLSICQKIVKNHGGFISAEGKAGEGAVFNIYLPESTVSGKEKNTAADQAGSRQKV